MPQAAAAEIIVEHTGPRMDGQTRIEGRALADWRADARRYLQLPDAPVVAAGHQAQAWHPGIVAKTFWTHACALEEQATPVHVVVDQDGFDGLFVEWPQLQDNMWVASGHRFSEATQNAAALHAPAFWPRGIDPSQKAPDFVREGLERLTNALRAFAKSPNAALQVTLAQLQDLSQWIQPPRVISASQLVGTSFALHVIDKMLREPVACAESFNAALLLHPRAARPLQVDGDRSELPLWVLGDSGERLRATAQSVRVAQAQNKLVLPRAFLLGVLIRTALADRFTHGLGGKIYEKVSNAWMSRWLGWTPPAFDVISANVRLPLEAQDMNEISEMISFRSAWCDPDQTTATDIGPSARRKLFLDKIAASPRRSPQRKSLYQDMVLDRTSRRTEFGVKLALLQSAERAQKSQSQSKQLTMRRTWCASFYPKNVITDLHQQIAHAARNRARSPEDSPEASP